ncbi:toll/interleukin-1 receptor domain-containing protein [Streptomyces microflavus]|uniref:toll/interleukin-1 receptor domain-containing protein n=1 Tax=Streptomyces microflavus TaxID=1919 RepID=UPI0037F65E73
MHAFISHNHRDKPVVQPLASRLRLIGVDVWLDSWEIQPGDSIPGKVNEALGVVDTVMVFWSANAAASAWVNTEWHTALTRRLSSGDVRLIPVRLDQTPLPPLLQPLMWVSLADGDVDRATRELVGAKSSADFNRMMRDAIRESRIEFRYFPGYGALVGCPTCGAPSSELEGWEAEQEFRHASVSYAGVRCIHCGWEEGGHV